MGGCLSSKETGIEQPMVTIDPAVDKPLENFNQLTEEERKAASGGGEKRDFNAVANPNNEDLAMKHWKYNRDSEQQSTSTANKSQNASGNKNTTKQTTSTGRNYSSDNGDYNPAVIQLLTEDELQFAVHQLVKLGYLAGTKVTENDFRAALTKFQTAQNLKPSGLLDKDTLAQMKNPTTALAEK